jgi:hypothetical protein
MNTINTLDDIALIQQFIQGRAKLSFNHNLRIEPVADTVQLLTKKGLLLATVNLASQFKVIFVRQSTYWQQINQVLLENHLMPTGKIESGLMRYEYHPVPIGYQINYAEALNVWKLWRTHANSHKSDESARINLLVFAEECWQPIQEMAFSQESIFIKTYASEIMVHSSDRVIWISPNEGNETPEILAQPAIPASQSNLESTTTISATEKLQPINPSLWEASQTSDKQLISQLTPPSTSSTSNKNKNILSIDKGKLYIQTVEGEIVVEGSSLRFWFSPPEGQNIIPQPIEVK